MVICSNTYLIFADHYFLIL